MKQKTRNKINELIDLVDGQEEIEVVNIDVKEYWTGDPTSEKSDATGAEVSLRCFFKFDKERDEDNQFQVK